MKIDKEFLMKEIWSGGIAIGIIIAIAAFVKVF